MSCHCDLHVTQQLEVLFMSLEAVEVHLAAALRLCRARVPPCQETVGESATHISLDTGRCKEALSHVE